MATNEFALALDPAPQAQFVRVDRARYDRVLESIIEILRMQGPMTFRHLGDLVEGLLQEDFQGSVSWYCAIVKWDLEACGALKPVPHSDPPQIEIT